MCSAIAHVRFAPESDINRGNRNVRFVPKADIKRGHQAYVAMWRIITGEQSRRYRGAVSCEILSQKASSSRYTTFVVAIR
jgi:hypothetical protein